MSDEIDICRDMLRSFYIDNGTLKFYLFWYNYSISKAIIGIYQQQ